MTIAIGRNSSVLLFHTPNFNNITFTASLLNCVYIYIQFVYECNVQPYPGNIFQLNIAFGRFVPNYLHRYNESLFQIAKDF